MNLKHVFGSKPDFSGFTDCSTWEPRQLSTHYSKCMEAKHALTASSRTKIEKENGARYSELLRLPYYNVIRYHVIEPMHNLFVGIAKHTTSIWKDCGLLKAEDFKQIQEHDATT